MANRQIMSALCAATALSAFPAHAQSAASGEPTPSVVANEPRTSTAPSEPGTPAASQATPSGDSSGSSSGDIVVNAQRRAERLVDVPISVTAITPQQLISGGVNSSTDLDRVTPGLIMATTASHAQPNIRGVGSALTGPGADNNVAVYVDGVYQASQSSLIFDFNNVQQIEVLKGPQGTLFGRNATGGAITVKTLDPGFSPEVRASAGYGRFDDYRVNAYVNVPLGDKVAFNVAGLFRDQGGYIRNLFNGKRISGIKAHAVTGKLLLEPTSNFRVILSGTYSDRDDKKNESFAPYGGPTAPYIANPTLKVPGPYQTNEDNTPIYNLHVRSGSMRTELELDPGTLSTITAYIHYRGNLGFDLDQSPLKTGFSFLFDRSNTFSQEVNFASKDFGAFNFVTGLFYYHDKATRNQILTTGTNIPFLQTRSDVRTEAYAAYAEGTYDISSELHLTGGIRYSSERKVGNGVRVIGAGVAVHPRDRWNALTPRVALRYEVSPSSNVYASYSKGFKSGVFNVAGLQALPVNPENINAYEVGFKSSARGLKFSASAFYYDYSDIQVQSQLAAALLVYQNAASATIYGGDFDASLNLTDDLSINGGLAYTHGRYDRFPGALTTSKNAATGVISVLGFLDQSGSTTVRTPEFQGNIGVNYTHRFDAGTFGATSTLSYIDKYFVAADNRQFVPSSTQLSGEISWTTKDDRYRFSIWGKNLTNEVRLLYLTGGSLDLAIYDVPRTFGFTIGFNFK